MYPRARAARVTATSCAYELLRLLFVGELDRLHIPPRIEDPCGFTGALAPHVYDYTPVIDLEQFATHPCVGTVANAYHYLAPDPPLRGRLLALLSHRMRLPLLLSHGRASYPYPGAPRPSASRVVASEEGIESSASVHR